MEAQDLIGRFDYDIWANRLWIEALPRLPFRERAEAILVHILGCHTGWYASAAKTDRAERTEDLGKDLEAAATAWKDLLRQGDPGVVVEFTRRNGDVLRLSLADVAAHVANHGTYHRGHLRGLAEAAGTTDFPDTDLVFFPRGETLAGR